MALWHVNKSFYTLDGWLLNRMTATLSLHARRAMLNAGKHDGNYSTVYA